MQEPIHDERADALIDQLRAGVEYKFIISIRNLRLEMRPLTINETTTVAKLVQDKMNFLPPTQRTGLEEHVLMARETLRVASSSQPGGPQLLQDAFFGRLTNDELKGLYSEYARVVENCNPCLETMPQEKFEQVVEVLKKSPKDEMVSELLSLSYSHILQLTVYLLTPRD